MPVSKGRFFVGEMNADTFAGHGYTVVFLELYDDEGSEIDKISCAYTNEEVKELFEVDASVIDTSMIGHLVNPNL